MVFRYGGPQKVQWWRSTIEHKHLERYLYPLTRSLLEIESYLAETYGIDFSKAEIPLMVRDNGEDWLRFGKCLRLCLRDSRGRAVKVPMSGPEIRNAW